MGKIVAKARQARLAYQVRLGRTVTIQEVATEIGVTRAYLSNVERRTVAPSLAVLAKLCQVYQVPLSELVEYEEDRTALYLAHGFASTR